MPVHAHHTEGVTGSEARKGANGVEGGIGGGNGDGNGGGNGDGSRDGNENNSGDGNGNEDRIEEGGREAKKRKKPHKSCRRHVGNGGDLDGKRKNVDKKGLVQKLPTLRI